MVARYKFKLRPEGSNLSNGGRRPGAGRPFGSINRATKLAIDQAQVTGKLPHELMLEWAQTGIINHVKLRKARNGIVVIDRDENGCPTYEEQALTIDQRLRIAKDVANYFAAKLVARVEQSGGFDADRAEIERDAEEVRRKLLEPLAAKPWDPVN